MDRKYFIKASAVLAASAIYRPSKAFVTSTEKIKVGVLAQRLNSKIEFNPLKNEIVNDKFANALLIGPPPRKDWEQFYKI